MSQTLTSNLTTNITVEYSKQNNAETKYSLDKKSVNGNSGFESFGSIDSFRLKSGANYESEIQYGFEKCGLTVIKENDTSFPAYSNEHGADLVFINPFSGKPVTAECTNPSTKMKDKDMQEKLNLNEKEKHNYRTNESLLIISYMGFLSKKMRLEAKKSYTWIIETGCLKLPNLKVWRQNKRTWVRKQMFRENLQRQITKLFKPEAYRGNEQYQQIERTEKETTAINIEYKPLIKKEAAKIYKLKNKIKKMKPDYKDLKCHVLNNSILDLIKQYCNNKAKYQQLTEIHTILKEILSKHTNITKTLVKPIIQKPENQNTKQINDKEEKKWVSCISQIRHRLPRGRYRGKQQVDRHGNYWYEPIVYKMTEAEVHNMYVMYYQKDREEEIKEDIETLKEFGFSKEEILAMF